MQKANETTKRAIKLRKSMINDKNEILVANLKGTNEEKDTSKVLSLMPNIKTNDLLFRFKYDIKDLDPLASKTYGKKFIDASVEDESAIIDFAKHQEFDFPLWYKHQSSFKISEINNYNPKFLLQVGGCNFHRETNKGGCWFCFVDDKSDDGKLEGKKFLSINDTIDSFIDARKKVKSIYETEGFNIDLKVLRVSGGEPSIIYDWVLRLWEEINRQGQNILGQIDTNLSTLEALNYFESAGIIQKNLFERLSEFPIKVLAGMKGISTQNLRYNTLSDFDISCQNRFLEKLVRSGNDVYFQLYNPFPESLRQYIKHMDSIIEHFSLRLHIGHLHIYDANKHRALKTKIEKAETNALQSEDVINDYLNKAYGVNYKDAIRSDVELKVLK